MTPVMPERDESTSPTGAPAGTAPTPRFQRTPLAWSTLVHDRRRLASSTAGIAFAVVLMLTELGFLHAIYDSSTLVASAFDADLLLVSPHKDDMNPSKPFPRARIQQARAVDGVEAVYPVWMERRGTWSSRGHALRDVIRVVAFDPADPVFSPDDVRSRQHLLQRPDTALVDRKVRDSWGDLESGRRGELNRRRVELVGDFELGPDLQLNANLLTSDVTFRRVFFDPRTGRDPLERVEFGVVRLQKGAEPAVVAERLRAVLPGDVTALMPRAFERRVHRFWTVNQPVGAVFGLGFVVGFLIGLAICYQVLFTDVIDQLPQFATLKAMGYGNRYLRGLAVRRGVLLSLFALGVGVPVGALTYRLLEHLTALTFDLTPARVALVAVTSVVMCVLASLLAMRRAVHTDPVEIF